MDRSVDPRLPVLVGVGQLNQRVDTGDEPLEPVAMMAEALRRAGEDSGAGAGLLAAADSVRVVRSLSWRYRDPGALVAAELGAAPRQSVHSAVGGNMPQAVVNRAALDIQDGRSDVVLICGAEAWRTRTTLRSEGAKPAWTSQGDDVSPAEPFGDDQPMSHDAEVALGVFLPVHVYPLFESALRAAAGRTVAEHQRVVAELWSGFSEVASSNPAAWIQQVYSPDEIGTPGPANRMVSFPYTKLLCSNNAVEQAAGLVLCSAARAGELGVPSDRWVFPLAGADAHDTPFVSNRVDLCSSPAIRHAGAAALGLAGLGIDDVAHVDLYSCFPSAVQVAAAELGLGLDRPLTVTGGLSFAGGPWNNYVTHAIATMAGRLRADGAEVGLCTANGGYLTKHSVGLYSTRPPASGRFGHGRPQVEVDREGRRELAEDWEGRVTVEAVTVAHDRDGQPETGMVALRTPDLLRAWGTTTDADAMAAMTTVECVGRPGRLGASGDFSLG